jgi:membrane fusion protein (multidrug efflux system)
MRIGALFVVLLGCGGTDKTAAPAGPPPVPVKVVTLAAEPLDRVLSATGTVETVESADIRPEIQGLVEEVLFQDGAVVKKGDPLVRMRSQDARASVLDAQARAQLAKVDLERAKTLFDRGDVAQAELDRAVAADTLATATVDRAEETLRRTTVSAPFDGVVGRREVSRGEIIDPTHTITRIESLSRIVVDVAFAESDLGRLATGQAAEVGADALPGETFRGTVTYVAPRVREDTRTVDVRVAIDDPSMRLRPGLTALARIVTSHVGDALLVPSQAIVRSDAGPAVYVAVSKDDTATAELRPIKTGERTNADVEVVSGLAVGDRVIIEGLARLKPGAPVAVEATAESAGGATAERSP